MRYDFVLQGGGWRVPALVRMTAGKLVSIKKYKNS